MIPATPQLATITNMRSKMPAHTRSDDIISRLGESRSRSSASIGDTYVTSSLCNLRGHKGEECHPFGTIKKTRDTRM